MESHSAEQIFNFVQEFEKLSPDRDPPNRAGRASPCEPRPLCVRLDLKKNLRFAPYVQLPQHAAVTNP
jgi:hypothetical protein